MKNLVYFLLITAGLCFTACQSETNTDTQNKANTETADVSKQKADASNKFNPKVNDHSPLKQPQNQKLLEGAKKSIKSSGKGLPEKVLQRRNNLQLKKSGTTGIIQKKNQLKRMNANGVQAKTKLKQ